ncbi:hypothetical protein MMC28_010205 [Mycoblastus sanguinarius]|nr:hypothetical protein [Mycoblastus sanguinarius]
MISPEKSLGRSISEAGSHVGSLLLNTREGACNVTPKILYEARTFEETLPMVCDDNSDKIACDVICRERYLQSKYSELKPTRQRDHLALLMPGFIRMAWFLKMTLTEFADNSEMTAERMREIAYTSSGSTIDMDYKRFSADNGVCNIKMDKYKALDRIEDLTRQYLEKPETRDKIRKVGEEIAREYLQNHRPRAAAEPATVARLTVPDTNTPSSQTPSSQVPGDPEPSTNAPPSTNSSSECPESNTQHGLHPPTQDTDPKIQPTSPIPSNIGTGHFPADAMVGKNEIMSDSTTVTA